MVSYGHKIMVLALSLLNLVKFMYNIAVGIAWSPAGRPTQI